MFAVDVKAYKYPVPSMFRTFFANIIGLPGHKNKRKSVLEITKMYYF